jgi:RimJ/RimL family protein N-acetyltransferase
VVGFCGLVHPNGQVDGGAQVRAAPRLLGARLATEAASAMLAYAESVLGLDHVDRDRARRNTSSPTAC